MTKSLREVWDHLVSHQVTRDIDGWIECFAADGVLEWPFRLKGVPARLEGRDAIRAAVAPVWERATKVNRRISGHENVVFHQTTDPEIAIRHRRRNRARFVPPRGGVPAPRSRRSRAPVARVRRHRRAERALSARPLASD